MVVGGLGKDVVVDAKGVGVDAKGVVVVPVFDPIPKPIADAPDKTAPSAGVCDVVQ